MYNLESYIVCPIDVMYAFPSVNPDCINTINNIYLENYKRKDFLYF